MGGFCERKGVIYYLKDEWNNEAAYDFKSITFCNLNTAGVDTYNDLPNDGSQYYYTFNLINTARDNGDYATCMSLDATIYNNVNISNAPGKFQVFIFVISAHIKTRIRGS